MSDDPDEYRRAAHEEASEQVWLDVIARFPEMRKWVAHNKTVPVGILAVLATDSDFEVRWWVAWKRKLTRDLFDQLSNDVDPRVRAHVACNPKCPEDILEKLRHDSDEFVAKTARNEETWSG